MKKIIPLTCLIIMLAVIFTACGKTKEKDKGTLVQNIEDYTDNDIRA